MENKNRNTAAIGVFDSGVGGLTVTREIMRQLPNENVVYFGDTARVPYGSKSKNNIIRFSRQIIRFLKTKNVKAIVIACNTASALALETVQQEFDIPIIGVKSCRKGDQEWSDWCTWYRSNDQERDLYQRNPETYAGGRSHRKAMSVIRTVGRRRICKA